MHTDPSSYRGHRAIGTIAVSTVTSAIIADSFIRNNNLEGTILLSSENINIDSSISGTTSKKIFDINSKIDYNGEDNSVNLNFQLY